MENHGDTLSRRDMLFRSGALAAGFVAGANLWVPRAMAQSASFDYYISPTGSDNGATGGVEGTSVT